jgi:hypothetical protein
MRSYAKLPREKLLDIKTPTVKFQVMRSEALAPSPEGSGRIEHLD